MDVPDVDVLATRGAESGLLELEVFPDLAQGDFKFLVFRCG